MALSLNGISVSGRVQAGQPAEIVFSPLQYSGNGSSQSLVTGVDNTSEALVWIRPLPGSGAPGMRLFDTVAGSGKYILSTQTGIEVTDATTLTSFDSTGFSVGSAGVVNTSSAPFVAWNFKSSTGFFDIVGYTGTGSNTTIGHSLGVTPELIIVKNRSFVVNWSVWHSALAGTDYQVLNSTAASATDATMWNSTTPTSSVFSVGTNDVTNRSADSLTAYLFATKAGISKVGTYTGTGASQAIGCGFAAGARFVLIKNYSSTGDWCGWDIARGMDAVTSPFVKVNATAVTSTTSTSGNIQSTTGGFTIGSTDTAAINTNGQTYVYLAIA